MATQKRRVIYLSDDDWANALLLAGEYKTTVSAVVRLLVSGRSAKAEFEDAMSKVDAVLQTPSDEAAKMAEDIRSFNSKPFTPVPKKGK